MAARPDADAEAGARPGGGGGLGGLRALLHSFGQTALPAGVGWPHTLGALLLTLVGVQLATGLLLALEYAPLPGSAWASVRFIQQTAPFGWAVRGLHHFAASAFIVLSAVHLVRTFLWGAYKGRRRWTWVTGLALLGVLCGFAFTGYLLPWDLRAYAGTKVGIEILAGVPGIGESLKRLVTGGAGIGARTLTRFYAGHVIALPLALLGILGLHLALIRRHGITAPWRRTDDEASAPRPRRFWPEQAAKDAFAALVLVLVLLGLALVFGAPLGREADPFAADYVPHPEWYFLGLQHLLRIFQGPWEPVGTVLLPGLLALFLVAVPWLDRNPERRLRARPVALAIGAALLIAVVGLTVAGALALGRERRELAARLAEKPSSTAHAASSAAPSGKDAAPSGKDAEASAKDPEASAKDAEALQARGRALYTALACDSCHDVEGKGVNIPPTLRFEGSRVRRSWLAAYLRDPKPIRYLREGERPVARMPSFRLSREEAEALAAYVQTRTDPVLVPPGSFTGSVEDGALLTRGERLFEDYQCLGCHRVGERGARVGPELTRIGSRLRPDFIRVFIQNPGHIVPGTAMKEAGLWDEEADAITAYLSSLR